MKKILLIIFLGAAMFASAAGRAPLKVEKPDLEQIRQEVLNPRSNFYFPKLQDKFSAHDTVMTPEEFRYFYLGYMFQEDYDPYRISQFVDSTADLIKRIEAGGKLTRKEAETVMDFTEKSLNDNPLDLRQMSFHIRFLREKGKTLRARFWEFKLRNLIQAIMSTGTGLDIDNAWYAVYPMHEYDLLQYLGYQAVDAEFPQEGIDRLKVKPYKDARRFNGTTPTAFYFNVAIPEAQYSLKHPGEEDAAEEPTAPQP